MPLYEYKCTACHKHTEKIQKFSDPEITACPHCGGHLERVISAPAVSFKGGGWYADGYGNAKPKSSGDSTSTATSDSKPNTDSKSSNGSKPANDSAPPQDLRLRPPPRLRRPHLRLTKNKCEVDDSPKRDLLRALIDPVVD
jgi:putative FmdB family regulatory protein